MNRKANFQGNAGESLSRLSLVELYRHANERLALRGIGVAQIADHAHTEVSRVYAYQAADAETLIRVYAIAGAQAHFGEPLVLRRMAERENFLLVPMPAVCGPRDGRNLEAVQLAMREVLEATEAFGRAVEDGRVTSRELDLLTEEIHEAEAALQSLRAIAAELCDEELRSGPEASAVSATKGGGAARIGAPSRTFRGRARK